MRYPERMAITDNGKDLADRVKALRLRANLTMAHMADALGLSTSGYAHYEDPARVQGPYLRRDSAEKIAAAMPTDALKRAAADLAGPVVHGFSEPGHARGAELLRHLDALDAPPQTAPSAERVIKIAVVGDTIQVFATVDAAGLAELVNRLQLAGKMIE